MSIKIVHLVENSYLGRDKESDAESVVNTQGDIWAWLTQAGTVQLWA